MNTHSAKKIFYFDDDGDCIQDTISLLKKTGEYNLIRASHEGVIKKEREIHFDLVIIDLTIHHFSLDDSGKEVENISYDKIPWKRTGVEFLKRIRNGEYEKYGFLNEVPVIIASAVVDYDTKQEVYNLNISHYIEKPFTTEELEIAIKDVSEGKK